MDLLEDPRYKDTPVYLFFEKYILDIVDALPDEKRDILENMNLQEIFKTHASHWREIVREVLQLSSTIDIAITYHWLLYLDEMNSNDQTIDPTEFSQNFVDAYFSEMSTIDLWTEDSLMQAKQYIQENQTLQKA